MPEQAANVAGMVLAGGRSRRLGQDKVLLCHEGATYLARSVQLLQRFCASVMVSGRDPSLPDAMGQHTGAQAAWLPDDVPGIGPMGGVMAGLRHLGQPLLVIACDLPLLDGATLSRLLEFQTAKPATALMTTFLQRETGFIESLVAIYEPGALAHLEAASKRGEYKLSNALPRELRHELPYSREREGRVFFNINRPQDLQQLEEMLGEGPRREASCS